MTLLILVLLQVHKKSSFEKTRDFMEPFTIKENLADFYIYRKLSYPTKLDVQTWHAG